MSILPYNSRDKAYKSVFGALKVGEETLLSLAFPRDLDCIAAYLVIFKDGEQSNFVPLEFLKDDGNAKWWQVKYVPEKEGLYFYHFEYDTYFGRGKILMKSSGQGAITTTGTNWQLTVYRNDFETPEWIKGGIIYQIFPDRFYYSGQEKYGIPNDRYLRSDWGGLPEWQPKDGKYNTDYFRGDLRGIQEKLSYIASLGVNCIYLNPIFEAHSNHRYDTADYMKIDSLLGTEKDFIDLCRKAQEHNIRIILDGVFSHTGADSVYFNRNKRYGEGGAYNSKESPYYHWYRFKSHNDDYAAWWGIKTLPEVNEENESFSRFITEKNGVIDKWLKNGAFGFRLDVADELPDSFIEKIRQSIKSVYPEGFLIGEVWEDASNKLSFGYRRKYLHGKELDSVMNYPFRDAIINFMLWGIAETFMEKIITITENYPLPVLHSLMNPLGTHDTERILTALSGESLKNRQKEWQANFKLSEQDRERATRLLIAAATLQYMLPGVPSIYYGDEAGLEGCRDPFNRGCFPWGNENAEIQEHFIELGKLRKENESLKDGDFVPVSAMLGCVAFARKSSQNALLIIANKNDHEIIYNLPPEWHDNVCLIGGKSEPFAVRIPKESCAVLRKNNWR